MPMNLCHQIYCAPPPGWRTIIQDIQLDFKEKLLEILFSEVDPPYVIRGLDSIEDIN